MSAAEDQFAKVLDEHDFSYAREVQFHMPRAGEKKRLWRFDFVISVHRGKGIDKVAVEIEGGGFVAGRHNRGAGSERDMVKYNTAACAGWLVLRFSPKMIKPKNKTETTIVALEFLRQAVALRAR